MMKSNAPLCGLYVCQQCSCAPKVALRNGRKKANPAAQALVRALHEAVAADGELSDKVLVRATRCQGACDKPIAFSLNSERGEGWQFNGAGDRLTVADMLAIVRAYVRHAVAGTRGVKTDWPDAAGPCFVVRIPAFPRVAKWIRVPKG